jgi:hypothetical protein
MHLHCGRPIVTHIKRLARTVRENADLVIWIQNTATDTWDTWSVRHEFQSSESTRYRIAAWVAGCSEPGSVRQ